MNSPKHLWSGDWERESTDPPVEAVLPAAPQTTPEPPTPPAASASTPSWRTRQSTVFGGVIAVLVIVGVALAFSLGGSSKATKQAQAPAVNRSSSSGGGSVFPTQTIPQTTTPGQNTPQVAQVQTQTTPVVGPTFGWLGTQIIDSSSGVTVEAIKIGSAADTAGVNPGDVIQAVNSTQIGSVAQLKKATDGLTIGKTFQLIVDRGTTQVTLSATLTDRPVKQS